MPFVRVNDRNAAFVQSIEASNVFLRKMRREVGQHLTRMEGERTIALILPAPDSQLATAITEFIRDTETELLFNHSSRVYHFGALAGVQRGLKFDHDLLYAGAMFHDLGLMPDHANTHERFEVDGANAARSFLKSNGVSEEDAYTV
jgi:hypothetical protein